MSRKPQVDANLLLAAKIRKSGAKTKIHSEPEIKQFIDYHLKKGNSNRAVHRMTVEKFGKERSPSLQALNSYVKKHYAKENSVSVPRTIVSDSKDFDALDGMRKEIDRMKEVITANHMKELSMLPMTTMLHYRVNLIKAYSEYLEIARRLGLLDMMPEAPNTVISTLNVQNNNFDAENITFDSSSDMTMLDKLISLEREEKEYADSHRKSETTDGNASPERSVQPEPQDIQHRSAKV